MSGGRTSQAPARRAGSARGRPGRRSARSRPCCRQPLGHEQRPAGRGLLDQREVDPRRSSFGESRLSKSAGRLGSDGRSPRVGVVMSGPALGSPPLILPAPAAAGGFPTLTVVRQLRALRGRAYLPEWRSSVATGQRAESRVPPPGDRAQGAASPGECPPCLPGTSRTPASGAGPRLAGPAARRCIAGPRLPGRPLGRVDPQPLGTTGTVTYPWRREGPRPRLRRPRARPRQGPGGRPRRRRRRSPPPATPASTPSPCAATCRSTCSTATASPPSPLRLGVDLVVVGPEAPARRRRGRRRARRRDRLLRAVRGGGAARGQQGLRQGGHGRGRRPDGAGPRLHDRRARSTTPSTRSARRTSSRTTASPPARASSSPTTATRPWRTRTRLPGRPARGRRRGVPRRPRGLGVLPHRRRRTSCRCPRPRTSSASATATTGPNTGGMGAYSPLDWAPAGLVDDVRRSGSPSRRSTRCAAAAPRSSACSTSAWP